MIGQMTINNDMGMNEMQSIGKALLNYERVDSLEEMNADIMSVTPDALLSVAQAQFRPDGISTLVYRN